MVQATFRGILEIHCPHQFIKSHLYLWSSITKGIIQTINETMHSIDGNNLIVGTFSEMMFLEDHELFQSTIGYAIKLCRNKEVIK